MTIGSTEQQAGDDALLRATGKPRSMWRSLLRSAGASTWPHKQIAEWLRREHAVPDWWCQSITVDFEQHIGRRRPGQAADGSFETTVSRSVAEPQVIAFETALRRVSAEHGEPVRVSAAVKNLTARWTLRDGTSLLLSAMAPVRDKVSVRLTLSKLPDDSALAEQKGRLRALLEEPEAAEDS